MKTRKSITYLFRGLVLGTLMIAAIGIYFGATSSGAGDDPSSRGNQVGIAAPSSQTIKASQAASYWIRRDEAEEMAYDELSKNFIGIPSPGTNSNELTGNDFRIMEEQRAADRQDDLRFMIQYWNELKKDEATNSTLNDLRQIK
jgi:hypothetical protein